MSETIRVVCAACGKGVQAPIKYAGRVVKCPGCQGSLTIPSLVSSPPPPPIPASLAKVSPTEELRKTVSDTPEKTTPKAKKPLPAWVIPVVIGAVCLTLGYFAGREHLRRQMANRIAEAATVFKEGMQGAFGGVSPSKEEKGEPEASASRLAISGVSVDGNGETGFRAKRWVSFTARNTSKEAFIKARLYGEVTTPGRTYPWAQGYLRIAFEGGLEPGESREVTYSLRGDLENIELIDGRKFSAIVISTE